MNERRFLALLFALTLIRGLIYAAVVPPWQAPDEAYHFVSAQLVGSTDDPASGATFDRLKSETTSSLVEFQYWDMNIHEPSVRRLDTAFRRLPGGSKIPRLVEPRSLVYYIPSAWLSLAPHQGIAFQLYWARLLSALINLSIVATAYATARLLFGNDPFGTMLLPLSIVFLPLHTYILSVVNDGNPTELFASLAIFFWIWGLTRGWHWSKMAGMGVFAALAIAAKPTGFYLILAIPLWTLLHFRRRIDNLVNLIYFLGAIGLVVGATFLLKRVQNMFLRAWEMGWLFLQGQPLNEIEALGLGVFRTIRAFWAQMGWTSLLLSDVWGNWLVILSLLAGLGVLKFFFIPAARARDENPGKDAIFVLLLCALANASHVPIYTLVTEYGQRFGQSQSRYLFSAIIPIMALLVIGWRELIPRNWRVEGLALVVSFFFLFDAVVLLNYGVPFFYPLWR